MPPYVAGIVLSLSVAVFARWLGFDRVRAFCPAVLIVMASYYVLFAAVIGSVETVLLESIVMTLFVIAAVAGFKGSPWIIVTGLAAHGVQDAVHGHIIANAGVPAWWPAWCVAYDVGAACPRRSGTLSTVMREEGRRHDVTRARNRFFRYHGCCL